MSNTASDSLIDAVDPDVIDPKSNETATVKDLPSNVPVQRDRVIRDVSFGGVSPWSGDVQCPPTGMPATVPPYGPRSPEVCDPVVVERQVTVTEPELGGNELPEQLANTAAAHASVPTTAVSRLDRMFPAFDRSAARLWGTA
jgi:hypothetical protein